MVNRFFTMKWLFIFFHLQVFAMTLTALAQHDSGRFRFEHITVNDGLAHSDAMCVEQDEVGYIWIGTNNGINRYDGYELKKYSLPVNKRNGLSGNRIRDLFIDPQKRLWAGAENAGISLFNADQDRFLNLSQMPAYSAVNQAVAERLQLADVEVITADRAGRIWVGTRANGIFALTINTANQLTHIEQIALSNQATINYRVTALVADYDGTMWIGTPDLGLWSINPLKATTSRAVAQAAPFTACVIRALHIDRRGDLWIGTDRQILWVNQADRLVRHSFLVHPLPQSVLGTEYIYLDSIGHLWVGTTFGLYMWNRTLQPVPSSHISIQADQVSTFLPSGDYASNINSGRIEQIFEDRNQILWLSTAAGGLNKVNLRDKPFSTLERRDGGRITQMSNTVNCIQKDETHDWLWIGTRNGFTRYDLSTKTYRDYVKQSLLDDSSGIDVSAFCQASDGTLWVSTRHSGLITLKDDKLRMQDILSDGSSLRASRLESIIEDQHGSMWVASFELGLLRLNRQGQLLQRFHTGNSRLPTNRFTFLLYDKEKDLLWASTQNAGVLKLQITATSLRLLNQFSYKADDSTSLSVNYAWPLLKDHQGRLWIGTIGGGLNVLTTNAKGQDVVRRFDQQLPILDVESLLEDETGQLWMGGAGLMRFNPATGQWVSYVVEDGIQSNSFKVGAAWRDAGGTLYFGGIKGITYFQPQQILPNPYAPVVHLTGLRIFNKPVGTEEAVNGHVILTKRIEQTRAITLRSSDNDFSIDFVGFNYVNTRKQVYAYRLIGYNDSWVMLAPGYRSASFANLPAGEYTFEVKAENGEGKWSAAPAILHITILPPWYQTWLAYLLYTVVAGAVLLLVRRILLQQQALKNKIAFEHFQYEKEKELSDLKLRFFTNVSHELRTPLTLILGPMEELASAKSSLGYQEKIGLMHQQTRKLLDLVNQLMEFRKVESGHTSLRASKSDVVRFLTELFLIFKLKAEELEIDYSIEVPTIAVPMYFDRSKLEIIITNLLANALKYTPKGGKIKLLITITGSPEKPALFLANKLLDNYLQIIVQDRGVGMKANEVDRIFDSYYQATQTETMQIMGTGIGLSLVKQYVEAHKGEVTVQSEFGVGTAFTLRLPFGQAHLSPINIVDESLASELLLPSVTEPVEINMPIDTDDRPLGAGATRILVVEDNEELREYLQQLLKPTFDVFVAADGVEGWEKTVSLLPGLVISDVMMPRSDGLTLCRKIKQHPKTTHIPVILLTARVAAIHELEGIEMGADEYMAKPFNPKILYAKIASILQGRHQLKEYYHRQILLEPTDAVIPDSERQLLEKAMAIVEANLSEPEFNVPMLVREMGMSQSAFYRQIKAITGQTVVEFIRDIRMKRAAQLLIAGNLRVSEVAALVGMEDINHFRKTFQKVYNVSPSEYVKQRQCLPKSN